MVLKQLNSNFARLFGTNLIGNVRNQTIFILENYVSNIDENVTRKITYFKKMGKSTLN